jgi:hypothetical protein
MNVVAIFDATISIGLPVVSFLVDSMLSSYVTPDIWFILLT